MLEHFFVQCDDVREFWTSLNRWWNRRTSMLTAPYTITDMDILFGISTVENALFNLNFVLLFAKKYIHDCKITNQNIAFLSFLVLLRHELYYDPVNMHVSFRYRHLPDLYRTYRILFAHTGLVPFQYLHTSTGTIPANIFVGQYRFTIGIVVPAIYRQISSGPVSS